MHKNSSINSFRDKRAESKLKNQHISNNLESLAQDIRVIEGDLNTFRETSRQKSLVASKDKLNHLKSGKKLGKSKNKRKCSTEKQNIDYDDHYQLKPLDKIKKKSKIFKEQQPDLLLKQSNRCQTQKIKQEKNTNPADIISRFYENMIVFYDGQKQSQFERLLQKMIKLL